MLIGCLRQGLTLARDFRLDLGWLAQAAWTYVSDSVREPSEDHLETAADALVEMLSALARRQHEHRERTTDRLTAVVDTGRLPDELHEMAVYYLAKAQRDLGRSAASQHGMQLVADSGELNAPAARRGLAHLARSASDFPTALDAARTLGWAGRHHRIEGDVWWPHGDMDRAAAAYEAARAEAEEHGVAGERATSQAQRAFVLAFTDPARADDELDLAEQLLSELDLRATTLTTQIAALALDAGTTAEVEDRAHALRTEISVAGLASVEATLELTLCFHHAVRDDHEGIAVGIGRLRELTGSGDYAYYTDIAHFMADRHFHAVSGSQAQSLDGEHATRTRWHSLVTARREHLRATP